MEIYKEGAVLGMVVCAVALENIRNVVMGRQVRRVNVDFFFDLRSGNEACDLYPFND